MSGKEAGHYGCTKRIHVAGDSVLGKPQGAHGLGMLGISSYEGFSEGAKQDPTIWAHPIPRQEQGRGGSQGSPSSRHWALSWEWAKLGCGLTGSPGQSCEELEPRAATGWLWQGLVFLGVQ